MRFIPGPVEDWYDGLDPKTKKAVVIGGAITAGIVVVATGGAVAYAVAGSNAVIAVTSVGTVATGKAAVELAKRVRV